MKIKILLFLIILGNQIQASTKSPYNNGLKSFFNDYIHEKLVIKIDTVKIKKLNVREFNAIRKSLCAEITYASIQNFDSNRFNQHILNGLSISNKASNKNKVVSQFLNIYKNDLICSGDKTSITPLGSRRQHLFKLALFDSVIDLYDEILLNDEIYQIDFNGYEIINYKKETVLDYIDKLITDGGEDIEELESIRSVIIELGGKKGKDLK